MNRRSPKIQVATQTVLHLVEPLGFEITDSRLKRAGLDYWEHLKVFRHPSLEAFLSSIPKNAPKVFFSKKAGRTLFEHRFENHSYLIFGKETAGLPEELINAHPTETIRIPMFDARVRSLNLANSVGIAVYEAIRQWHTQ